MAIDKSAERKPRSSEQMFRAIFMALEEGAVLHNSSDAIVAVNPAAENILGITAAELIGLSSAECVLALKCISANEAPFPADLHPAVLALQTAKPQRNVQVGVHRPGGTLVWISLNAQPLIAEGESGPYAVVTTFTDITARKQAEKYEHFRSHTLELLSGSTSLPIVLEGIVRGVEQLNPGMICSILLLDKEGKRLGEGIAPSLPDFFNAVIDGIEVGVGAGCCGTAAATRQRVIADDIGTHPYWAPYKELAARAGLGACWSEPIRSSFGQVLGTFAIYHRGAYSPAEFDISLIEKSVQLVSIAIERKRAEEALRASEERMRLFFERQLVGMAITSPEKGWVQVNDKICEILGYSRWELERLTWAELTYPEDLAPETAQFELLLNGKIDSYTLEKRFVRKDGGIVYTHLAVSCVRRADQSVDYALTLLEDISARKQAELERHANANSLECMDRVNKAILGAADPDRMMCNVLDVVLESFGCDRAFLLPPSDPTASEWQAPMVRTRPEYPGVRVSGAGVPIDRENAELMHLMLATRRAVKLGRGADHPVPPGISEQLGVKSQMMMALFPKLGNPWQFGIHQCSHSRIWTLVEERLFEKIGWRLSDALAILLMYRHLQASEREFRTLAENLPDILVRYDREGRRTYANPALKHFNVTNEQVIGKTLMETNPTGMQMPEIYLRALQHTLATGERSVFEIQFAPSGDSVPTHLCFIAAERAEDGQITGAISVGRDITERKRNEAELERHRHHLEKLVEERTLALSMAKEAAEAATRAKSHFLAAASHDMRQPLQAIRLFNDALEMTGLDERQKKISNNLAKSVNSLGELLNQLLDLSRLDAGMIEPQPVVIRAWDLLGMIEAEFDSIAREKNLSLHLFCPRQDLVLFSDANLLLTLLRNLVSNAVKYTSRGGILVSIRRRDDRALIQVWDTGIGIAPELMESIFEEYFQVGNPERARAKGVGLGLSIVRRLSKLLGIVMHVRSREGKGSVFELGVPLANVPDVHTAPHANAASPEGSAPDRLVGKRIVIIEDDAIVAEAVKFALEMAGAHVTLFATAGEALGNGDALGADQYISDYRLPDLDGLQLLNALQSKSARPIRAVLLTGNTSPDQIAIMQSTRWKVLFKPIDLQQLLSAIES